MHETLANIVRNNDRTSTTAVLHIEVIADFVCPFSFIGKLLNKTTENFFSVSTDHLRQKL